MSCRRQKSVRSASLPAAPPRPRRWDKTRPAYRQALARFPSRLTSPGDHTQAVAKRLSPAAASAGMGQRLCGSQNGLPGANYMRTPAYIARWHCATAYRTLPGRPDKAFTPLSGITHHQKSKGCARICVTRGRRKVWRGAKPASVRLAMSSS